MKFMIVSAATIGTLICAVSAHAIALRAVSGCSIGTVNSEGEGIFAELKCPANRYLVKTVSYSLENMLLSAKANGHRVQVTFSAGSNASDVWTLRSMTIPE